MIDMKNTSNTVTLSSKYQVVIPASVRERLKLKPGAKLTWIEFDGAAHLVPLKPVSAYRGIASALKDSDIPNEADRL
ncbi:AbrB/MazE/SpoVT family DNA-binding domain-containing protein [Polaromonas sp.]|uniref:AbrB/MazE/SpoVT family DNA-binding domain-containing protein n=1 Tax=Polaromonas sp. TaxID=1869339 RepID=UPI0025DE3343|nr:AbrB/MazE/SpoVT family DNA-binding domain-containing protein [Polaromonas sp.]